MFTDDVAITTTPRLTDPIFINDQFLLAEDLALKQLLQGVTVVDGNQNPRTVGVWFSMPDPELQKQNYPYITIDLIDVVENRPQVMSSYGPIRDDSYLLNGITITDDTLWAAPSLYGLSPMLLTYQVTSWARQPRHDRAILAKLTYGQMHPRFAQINVNNNLRRLVVQGFSKRDTTTDNKRLFRNVWTIQIPSEIFYDDIALTRRAESVNINSESITRDPPDEITNLVFYPGSS